MLTNDMDFLSENADLQSIDGGTSIGSSMSKGSGNGERKKKKKKKKQDISDDNSEAFVKRKY